MTAEIARLEGERQCRFSEADCPGHAWVDLRSDLEPLYTEPTDHGTRGLATRNNKTADAGVHQTFGDAGQGLLHHVAGSIAAKFRLDGLNLARLVRRIDQHRPFSNSW